jgi:hypothetical protein
MAETRAGRMDPSGEGLIQAGRILGIIATILLAVVAVMFCAFFGLMFTVG